MWDTTMPAKDSGNSGPDEGHALSARLMWDTSAEVCEGQT